MQIERIIEYAKKYRLIANKTISANNHMNNLGGESDLSQDQIDALLVDFVNYIAFYDGGIDLALYSSDLKQ